MKNDEDYENWLAHPNEDAPQVSRPEMVEMGFMILLCIGVTIGLTSGIWLVTRGIFGS